MDYKSLLVHLDRGERRANRVELAFRLAERFGAHLTGLFALSSLPVSTRTCAEAPDFFDAMKTQRSKARHAAREEFEAAMSRHPTVSAEFRHSESDALEAVLLSACYADLIILGQYQRDAHTDAGLEAGFVGEVLVKANKPVLLIPYAGKFDAVGERVLVAWNGAPGATRAIDSMFPLLACAKEVKVAVFTADRESAASDGISGVDLGLYIARHHAGVSVSQRYGGEEQVGCQILNQAADLGADLIVMGAYGHSRARERLLGGATRTLLESMTAPVLMVH